MASAAGRGDDPGHSGLGYWTSDRGKGFAARFGTNRCRGARPRPGGNVRYGSPIPPANLVKALNDILPPSIRVLEACEAAAEFHARKSARAKTYRYRMYRGAICPPFLARYVWHYPYPLDEDAMQQAAELVIGEHDFTSFAAVDAERGREDEIVSNVRRIFVSTWEQAGQELDLHGPGQRISAPHGAKSGGNVRAGREKHNEAGEHQRNSVKPAIAPLPGRQLPPAGCIW